MKLEQKRPDAPFYREWHAAVQASRARTTAETKLPVPGPEHRTPWFASCIPPCFEGPYEVRTMGGRLGWCWWTGHTWGDCWGTLEVCLQQRDRLPNNGRFHWPMEWRGIVETGQGR